MATGTYTTRTAYNTFTDAEVNGNHYAGADLYTVYNCYQSGSFGQINSVTSAYWSPMGGRGDFTLEAPNAQSQPTGATDVYPTHQITTSGTVVLTTRTTSAFGLLHPAAFAASQADSAHLGISGSIAPASSLVILSDWLSVISPCAFPSQPLRALCELLLVIPPPALPIVSPEVQRSFHEDVS